MCVRGVQSLQATTTRPVRTAHHRRRLLSLHEAKACQCEHLWGSGSYKGVPERRTRGRGEDCGKVENTHLLYRSPVFLGSSSLAGRSLPEVTELVSGRARVWTQAPGVQACARQPSQHVGPILFHVQTKCGNFTCIYRAFLRTTQHPGVRGLQFGNCGIAEKTCMWGPIHPGLTLASPSGVALREFLCLSEPL